MNNTRHFDSWSRRDFGVACAALMAAPAGLAASAAPQALRPLARELYIWGYPTVDLYNILHGQVLDPRSPEYKAPFNAIGHVRDVATPRDTVVIAPNVDTPYSYAWLDLRAEPVVITLPAFEPERYMSMALFDLYTWIIDYVTPRTGGREGGDFMVVPPGWKGVVPQGIRRVFQSTTTLALAFVRTQLLREGDLPRVHALQDAVKVRTLSVYQGRPARPALPVPAPVAPLNLRRAPTSPEFLDALRWMLAFMPVLDDERPLRARMQALLERTRSGPGPGATPADLEQIQRGFGDALQEMGERARRVQSSAELFGSRAFLGQDYLARAVGAMLGILGNAAEEYLGIGYQTDSEGQPFVGSKRYRIRFAANDLPPVDAFWSITVYNDQRLLYDNPIRRHVINSPMVDSLHKDPDGGITLWVQHEAPEGDAARNWLPVPKGPFGLTFRTYLPRAAIREGRWRAPPVQPVG